MLCEAPNRLHWVRVRDALADVDGWQRVCITSAEGKQVGVVAADGDRVPLICARLERFPELLRDTLPHEMGGLLAFWSRHGRMIAIPEASSCTSGIARVVITASVVIIEEGRNFELVASDSTWRMRLFDARVPAPTPTR
jgi:hypothetical protein